jgi:hypothetical protein
MDDLGVGWSVQDTAGVPAPLDGATREVCSATGDGVKRDGDGVTATVSDTRK